MGIHNESGSHRMQATLPELVKTMLAQLLDQNDHDRAFVHITSSDKVVMLVNNLGGVSALEIGGILAEVSLQLKKDYGIVPVRIISGTFLTSLNGLGFSVSFLKLVDTGLGEGKSFLELLDAPAEAIGWSVPIQTSTWETNNMEELQSQSSNSAIEKPSNLRINPTLATKALSKGLDRIVAAEQKVTHYDTIVGDGDCGIGLKRGAEAILAYLNDNRLLPTDAVLAITDIVSIVETTMDGTSGAIYAIYLNALAHGLRSQDTDTETNVDAHIWANALNTGLTALSKYTPATTGDRTLLDALIPFVQTLQTTADVGLAVQAAAKGTDDTKHMRPGLGRAVYVGGESEWVGKIPDPGAYGLKEFLEGVAEGLGDEEV